VITQLAYVTARDAVLPESTIVCINIRSREYTFAATKCSDGLRAYSAETGLLFQAKLDTREVALLHSTGDLGADASTSVDCGLLQE
jgi:hypothetical protein